MATNKGIHFQPRDLSLLAELGEAALLDTPTIHARHFPKDKSQRACRRRLREFEAHDLIQSVHISVVRTDRVGRMPAIHRLTVEGADLVQAEFGFRPLRTARSEPPKPNTLLHRLGMAKVLLAMNDACRLQGLPKPGWILEYDSHPNVPPNAKLTERYILCRDCIRPGGSLRRSWPDAACQLTIPAQGRDWRLTILWEYDRSTERKDELVEKLVGLQPLIDTGTWRQFFPNSDDVRIFFVVPSEQRIRNLIELFRDSPLARYLRFAVAATVTPTRAIQDAIWSTTTGDSRPIFARQQ